jgi:hypothetical protein
VDTPGVDTQGVMTLMVLADGPNVVLEKTSPLGQYPNMPDQEYTFFDWLYNTVAMYGNDINLATHRLVARESAKAGIQMADYKPGFTFMAKPGDNVAHMTFSATDMPRLYDLASHLGVTHIIEGRYVDGAGKQTQRREYHADGTGYSGGTITTSTMRVHLRIHDTRARVVLFEKTYSLHHEVEFGFGDRHYIRNPALRKALLSAVLADIRASGGAAPPNVAAVDLRNDQELWISRPPSRDQPYVTSYLTMVRLARIERTDRHTVVTLRFKSSLPDGLHVAVERSSVFDGPRIFARNAHGETFRGVPHDTDQGLRVAPRGWHDLRLAFENARGPLGRINLFVDLILRDQGRRREARVVFREIDAP